MDKQTEKKRINKIGRIIGVLLYILLPGLIIFREYISLQKLFLFLGIASDSVNLFYPRFVMLAETFWEGGQGGLATWSFQKGLGQSIVSEYANPFNWIYILAGKERIPYLLFFVEYFKLAMSGILFYAYLRTAKQSLVFSAIGGILYAYCASIMVNITWLGPATMCMILALGLLTTERFFQKGRWYLLPLFGFLLGSPVMLYQVGVVLLIYAVLRFKWIEKWSFVDFFKRCFQGLGFLFLGIGMKFFIYPIKINNMLNSPRGSGDYSYKDFLLSKGVFGLESAEYYWTIVYRFFSNDLLGNATNFVGWQNYFEAPSIFMGLLPLLLLPQILLLKNKRVKWGFIALVIVVVFTLVFPFFRYAFWLFAGDYFRFFGHAILVGFLLMSLYILKEIVAHKNVSIIGLLLTNIGLIGLLFAPNPYTDSIDSNLRMVIIGFLLVYSIVLVLYCKIPKQFSLLLALAIIIPIEIMVLGHFTYNGRESISTTDWEAKKGYNDYTIEALALIKEKEKNKANYKDFYRIEKDYYSGPARHGSLNDAQLQGYFSSSSYDSFNQIWYARFLKEMGIVVKGKERETRWIEGVRERLLLCFLTNTKYKFVKKNELFAGPAYQSIGKVGDISIFENQLFLPLGNTYNKYIAYKDFKQLDQIQKDRALFNGLVVEDEANAKQYLTKLTLSELRDVEEYSVEVLQKDINALRASNLQITSFKQDDIKGSIQLKEDKAMFFSIPYDNNWKAYVNGKEQPLIRSNIGFMALFLKAGDYKINLKYEPFMLKTGMIVSFVFLLITLGFVVFFRKEIK